MSYDIDLRAPDGSVLHMPEPFEDGGTYRLGGTTECSLNVTYNYASIFRAVLGPCGIRDLYGRTGAETREGLRRAVEMLGTEDDSPDYWAATPGNAGKALARLLSFAEAHPEGIWEGD